MLKVDLNFNHFIGAKAFARAAYTKLSRLYCSLTRARGLSLDVMGPLTLTERLSVRHWPARRSEHLLGRSGARINILHPEKTQQTALIWWESHTWAIVIQMSWPQYWFPGFERCLAPTKHLVKCSCVILVALRYYCSFYIYIFHYTFLSFSHFDLVFYVYIFLYSFINFHYQF